MKTFRLTFLLVLALAWTFVPAQPASTMNAAFVDASLFASTQESLAVIVTGESSLQAAAVVENLGGQITSDLWLIDAVGAVLPAAQLPTLAAATGIRSIVANHQIEASGSGNNNGWLTDVGWPVAKDVGAEKAHAKWITGFGVTVAVIDSGVYYDPIRLAIAGSDSAMLFAGQADFLGDGVCKAANPIEQAFLVQGDGYCLQKYGSSRDTFGHGSHVAGIISNNFRDAASNITLGIAPAAQIFSFRVLDQDGKGVYEDTIQAIQTIVQLKDEYRIRVINMSLSATATVPYFVDPLNRAVEKAWAAGIVVVAAAGNEGPNAETITVPGNDPYIITVGGLNTNSTPGDWSDDVLPAWSATGPTLDGFAKPDVLAPGANVVSFMYNSPLDVANSAKLALAHPDFSITQDLFRMSGTSMATAVTSGVVALMLQANPNLTPDQVKFRLIYSARPAIDGDDIAYNLLQQGAGRIWAPDAVFGSFPAEGVANVGMDIHSDLAHGYTKNRDLAYHYQGPLRKQLSDDGSAQLYFAETVDGTIYGFGSTDANTGKWLSRGEMDNRAPTWSNQFGAWNSGSGIWSGGHSHAPGLLSWSNGHPTWGGGMALWSGGTPQWAGGLPTWSGGMALWSGGMALWSGGMALWSGSLPVWDGSPNWAGGMALWSGGMALWSGSESTSIAATRWVEEDWGESDAPMDSLDAGVPAAGPASAHITDLEGSARCANRKCNWDATVTVSVQDNLSSAVADATVSLRWQTSNESGTISCKTNGTGICSVVQRIKANSASATFTVTDIGHPSLSYAQAANRDADGDSNGTTITVAKPSNARSADGGTEADEEEAASIQLFLPAVNNGR